jgi:hypothetical protein
LSVDVEAKERRLVHRLLIHWRELAPEEVLPPRARVNPDEIGDMWRYCFTLDIGAVAAVFAHLGEAHVAHLGFDLTGKPAAAAKKGTLLGNALDRLDDVLLRRIPITRQGTFTGADGMPVPYRSILLPLADDGNEINGILGAANCRLPEFM